MPYFSGQGKVFIGDREADGSPGPLRWVGNVPTLNLGFETDVLEHKESWSGARATDLRLLREKTTNITLALEETLAENLALALFGESSTITGASVTDEVLAGGSTNVANGDFLRLANADVSAVVIKDSDVGPTTLTEGTDYRIESAKHGSIEIINIGSFVQPFVADYTYADAINVNMLTQGLSEKWLRLEGINSAQSDKPSLVEVYRVAFDPTEEFELIGDEVANFTLNGSALIDATKEGDAVLGQFGRIVQITP